MTRPIGQMSERELVNAVEGYAMSARRSYDRTGKVPRQTLGRIRSMLRRLR